MPNHAFAMAAAAQAYIEHGFGHTLVTTDNKFFCGFEQDDGSVVAAPFRQQPEAGDKPTFSKFAYGEYQYSTDKPLFLAPAEMKEKGVAAVAYGHRSIAIHESGLPKALVEELKVASVRKDLTYKPQENKIAGLFNGPPSQDGLASPKACEEAENYIYVSLRKKFGDQAKQFKAILNRVFEFGYPY